MPVAQYRFEFPTEIEAKRFVHTVAWSFEDVALYRDGQNVSVIDGTGRGRQERLLTMAILKEGRST